MMNKKSKNVSKPALTDKQKRFCQEYLVDLNATQAGIKAGYSKKTAYSIGQRLLKNVEIQKHIEKLREKQTRRTQITADKVLRDIEDTRIRAKAANNFRAELKALELQGRHLAMFVDRQHISGEGGGPVAIRVIKQYLGEKPK